MRQQITDRRLLEEPWHGVPTRAYLPAAEQDAAVAVRCTHLAGSAALNDPNDVGGGAVIELRYADGHFELFEQYMAFHKSQGFEFGYGGSGPSALAANILGLLLPPREAWRLSQGFKAAIVARVPRDGGEIPMAAVRAWIEVQWATERADAALMREEAERRAGADRLGWQDDDGEA